MQTLVLCCVIVTWMQQSDYVSFSLFGFLRVAWVQLDYIRNNFFFFFFSVQNESRFSVFSKSKNSFIALSNDGGHNIRTLIFLTGLADLGRRWTKRARTAKWHDSCCGRTLDGGNYTPKRSRAYITVHNQEMKKWRNHSSAQIKGIRWKTESCDHSESFCDF